MKKAACFRFRGVSVFEFDQFWSVDDCSAGKRELGPTAATVGRLFSLTFYPLELKNKTKKASFLGTQVPDLGVIALRCWHETTF